MSLADMLMGPHGEVRGPQADTSTLERKVHTEIRNCQLVKTVLDEQRQIRQNMLRRFPGM
jgi:hypothetical protein